MTPDLMLGGLSLMLYGMGVVIVFLALLVLVTAAMSGLVNRFFPEPRREAVETTASGTDEVNPQILAAIQMALDQHRNRH